MQKIFRVIRKQYLHEEIYTALVANSRSLNSKLDQVCSFFQKYYEIIKSMNLEIIHAANLIPANSNYQFFKQFRLFLIDLAGNLNQIATFQIECLQSIKQNNQPQFEVLQPLLKRVNQNLTMLKMCQERKNQLQDSFVDIKNSYALLKKQMLKPTVFFDKGYMSGEGVKLTEKIRKAEQSISVIKSKKEAFEETTRQTQGQMSIFKKKLVKNKYKVHRKIFQVIQNAKVSLIQLNQLMNQCIRSRKEYFSLIQKNQDDDITYLRVMMRSGSQITLSSQKYYEENIKWEKTISKGIGQFLQNTQYLDEAIKIMINSLASINQKYQRYQSRMNQLINQLAQLYEHNESPQEEMMNILSVYNGMTRKFSVVVLRLTQIHNKLQKVMTNCKNHSEIVLSLLKVKKQTNVSLFNYQKDQFYKKSQKSQLKNLIEEISFKHVKELILETYDSFLEINLQLSLFLVSNHRESQQKPIDSMQLSHVRINKYLVNRKKPLKQEIWLWKDWKIQIQFNFFNFSSLFQEILSMMKKYSEEGSQKDGALVAKYKCNLVAKGKIDGFLIIKEKCLQFQSQDRNHLMSIDWKQIQNMQIRIKMFDKFLLVKTQIGDVLFYKFENCQTVLQSLKEVQEKNLSENTKINKKVKIALTPDQIRQINERKERIKGQLPKYEGFRLVSETTLQNQDIDNIYDIFYSDKPFNFYGKEEPCFFSYCGKKAGNFDWIAQKYDQPGPKFYTLQEGVDFTNCPLFSRRKFTFSVPLPSIPFMPSFCVNNDDRRIFWTSHQQFDYVIHSQTSGVMMSDSFFVEMIHKVVQIQANVKIEIYSKINFTKQISLKNVVISNTDPEIDKNMKQFIKQIQKVLRLRKSMAANGNEKVNLQISETQIQNIPQGGDQISKLKLHNKILLIVVASLILLNLISKIFF